MEFKRFEGESFEDFKHRLYTKLTMLGYDLTEEEAKTLINDISKRKTLVDGISESEGSHITAVTFEIKSIIKT